MIKIIYNDKKVAMLFDIKKINNVSDSGDLFAINSFVFIIEKNLNDFALKLKIDKACRLIEKKLAKQNYYLDDTDRISLALFEKCKFTRSLELSLFYSVFKENCYENHISYDKTQFLMNQKGLEKTEKYFAKLQLNKTLNKKFTN